MELLVAFLIIIIPICLSMMLSDKNFTLKFFIILAFMVFSTIGVLLDDYSDFFITYIFFSSIIVSVIKNRTTTTHTISSPDIKKDFNHENNSIVYTITDKLQSIGISDIELFKKELFDLFIKYENAYSNFDYDTLSVLCTDNYFQTMSNGLDTLKKYNRKRIFENIILNNFTITNIFRSKDFHEIHVSINISLNDYTIDTRNNIYIKGNKNSPIQKIFEIKFVRNFTSDSHHSSCPNCGAPVNSLSTQCSYCSSPICSKSTWLIDSLITSKINII